MVNQEVRFISRLREGKRYKIRCGILCPKKSQYDFKCPVYSLLCVLAGKGKYIDEAQQEHPFKAPCILQRFPNKSHSIIWDKKGKIAYIAAPKEVFTLFESVCISEKLTNPILKYSNTSEFLQEVDILFDLLSNLPENQLIKATNQIQSFFSKLFIEKTTQGQDLIFEIDKFLDKTFPEKVKVPQMAHHFGMSSSSFRAYFTKNVGIPPGIYIIHQRLNLAADMLLCTEYSIKEISDKTGYPDVCSFTKQFKKFYKLTPTQYRNQSEF